MTTSGWGPQGWQESAPVGAPVPQPAAAGGYAPYGAPAVTHAPPQAPRWSAPTHPGPATNLMAVLAIVAAAAGTTVLLGIGSIAAVVLGCLALAQVKKRGEDGRVLAVWAIILGAITLVALLAMVVLGVIGLVELSSSLSQLVP